MKHTLLMTTALVAACLPLAFENEPPPPQAGWKMDGDKIAMRDGDPVYIDASGKELTLGRDTIGRLNGEAKSHRTRAETAEAIAKAFEGLDAEAARKALDTVSKLDAKTLIDAGEVDKVRNSVKETYEKTLTEKDATISTMREAMDTMVLDFAFLQSDFVKEKLALPQDVARKYFADRFKVVDGKVVAKDEEGNDLFSPKRGGELATLDEALEIFVSKHPQKDTFLKADAHSGSGGNGGSGGGNPRGSRMKRSEFEALKPFQKAEASAKMRKGELVLVDG